MSKSKKLDPKTKSTIANVLSIVISYIVWATAISALLAIAVSQVIASITLFIHDLQYEYIDSLVGFIMQVAGGHSFVADLIGEGNMTDLAVLLEVAPEEKLNKAKDDCELEFRENFLVRMRENIESAQDDLRKSWKLFAKRGF